MTARVTVRIDLRELEELSERWEDAIDWIRSDTAGASAVALKAAQLLVGDIRREVLNSATGQALPGQRTGALARSFREAVKVTSGGIRISATSKLVYAGIQDRGGRIFPKRKFLAIPLTSVAVKRWPRDWPRGKLFRPLNRDGRPMRVLAESKGKNRLEFHYALARSVKIEPKNYIEKAQKSTVPKIARMFTRAIAKELSRG